MNTFDEMANVGFARWIDASGGSDTVREFVEERLPGNPDLMQMGAVFAHSPFLVRCFEAEPVFGLDAVNGNPGTILDELFSAMREWPLGDFSEAEVMSRLRRAKARAALVIALADILGKWDDRQVTAALSRLAGLSAETALKFLLLAYGKKGVLNAVSTDHPESGSGFCLFGMGKLGARELNFSSDIDLIALFDPDVVPAADQNDVQRIMIRLTRDLVRLLSDRTPDGYVFRTDLRLRPDPGSTPLAVSVQAAETYYESVGQNWERAAWIKARLIAGDPDVGNGFLNYLLPFIWRRHLDFETIRDIHSIKRQIDARQVGKSIGIAGHNVKLGRGGIREVEFFVQTQQLIWGGKFPELRGSRTEDALNSLAAAQIIPAATAEELVESYWFLRHVENRLQMVDDQQTHEIPADAEKTGEFAAFLGYPNPSVFEDALAAHLHRIEAHYAELFSDELPEEESEVLGNLVFTGSDDDPDTLATLSGIGFQNPSNIAASIRKWHHGHYRATQTRRAQQILTDIVPALLSAFARTPDPDNAFNRFDGFIANLPAGIQLFSMFRSHPILLDMVAEIMGAAPKLAVRLGRNPLMLDAILSPDFFDPMPSAAELRTELRDLLMRAAGYEDALDVCRRWTNDKKLQIGVQALRNVIDWQEVGISLSAIAEASILELKTVVENAFVEQHGTVPGSQWVIVAMGKLGGREMTPASDLDLVFLYRHAPEATGSDGARPLTVGQYFARLSQRLINAITAPTSEGKLYEVDMRLRPSGNAGPVCTPIDGFRQYHAEKAWTWEHMALTRARILGEDSELGREARDIIRNALTAPRDPDTLLSDIRDMRARIDAQHHTEHVFEVKYLRGGLIDIEFIAQYLQLRHAADKPEILSPNTYQALGNLEDARVMEGPFLGDLKEGLRLWQAVQGIFRLTIDGPITPETEGKLPEALKLIMARATGEPSFAMLRAKMADVAQQLFGHYGSIIGTGTKL